MLPVLLFSLTCRADDLRLSVAPPDSAIVRPTMVPRLVTMRVWGRPFVVRFAPHPVRPAKRDSLAADSLARKWQRVQAPNHASPSSLDRSPRLLAPRVCRGSAPVRIEYGVGEWGHASRLEVFDVGGRRVAELPVATTSPGRGVAWWQPAAGPGVYFVRLARPDAVLTRRIVRLS